VTTHCFTTSSSRGRVTRTIRTLSIVILTLNEEHNIAECIASVRGADEVVVIDSGSSDRTLEFAAASGARVILHPMTDFSEQRNFANQQAICDWILHLDADERVTPELMREIRQVTAATEADAFRVPTLNWMLGAPFRHGGWYPQYHIRLLRQGRGTWGRDVHESVYVNGFVGRLKEPIVHHSHPDISSFILKLDRYTDYEATVAGGSATLLAIRAVFEPGPYFIYKYVLQQGFRDGWRGLVMSLLLAYYRSVGYLKALELRRRR